MTSTAPRLTIGLPVRDGARYLPAAIDSLRKQTFVDFELILSDNASTDQTGEICLQAQSDDSRIRYHRFDQNVGAAQNFNHVLNQANGEFFKWAAHDDICAYPFAETCLTELDQDPTLVVCHTKTGRIDAEDNVLGNYESEASFDQPLARDRFLSVIAARHFCWSIFGLIRTDVLRQTPGIGSFVGSDRSLLAELALHGKIRLVPEVLFYRRDHPESSVRKLPDERARLAWFDPRLGSGRSFPTWRRLRAYAAAIHRSPLSRHDKAGCYVQLARWLRRHHHTGPTNTRMLLRDLIAAK